MKAGLVAHLAKKSDNAILTFPHICKNILPVVFNRKEIKENHHL